MSSFIVTTTINPPTRAIRLFDSLPDWRLVVVGDRQTPEPYQLERGVYLTPAMQEAMDPALSEAIGWRCIQRRNFGLLWAAQHGAERVALVDDDNVPSPGWGKSLLIGEHVRASCYETDLPAFDPLGATNYPRLWHRGFPLQLVSRRRYRRPVEVSIVPDIQADLWNGDPDVDAVCRMEHAPGDCKFDPSVFPMTSNRMAPFNSQNTFLRAGLLKDYFLFPHVGRMDDIWAAYYVQSLGYRLVFGPPSVTQVRNAHDDFQDLQQELPGYEHNLALVSELASDSARIFNFLPARAREAFRLYQRHFQ